MATADAAAGFSIHSGWAVAVVVAGRPTDLRVLHRARVPLVDPALPRQVFHAAADGPPAEAEALVRAVERSAATHAADAVGAARGAAEEAGCRLAAVALCAEPHDVPTDLAAILANHTLIHSAEGELYREAVEQAAVGSRLPVLQVRAKQVAAAVSDGLGLSTDRQRSIVADLGRQLGAPWQADHKQATLLAALALAIPPT